MGLRGEVPAVAVLAAVPVQAGGPVLGFADSSSLRSSSRAKMSSKPPSCALNSLTRFAFADGFLLAMAIC